MDDYLKYVPIIGLLITLVAGGLAGAIVTALVTYYRNRLQPIGKQVIHFDIFSNNQIGDLKAYITLEDNNRVEKFENLSLINLKIVNKGNVDYSDFSFGITHKGSDKAVYINTEPPDRNHIVKILTDLTLQNPNNEIDFILEPFNRKDLYSFDILISASSTKESNGGIYLSTKHAIRFVDDIEIEWDKSSAIKKIQQIFSAILLILTLTLMIFLTFSMRERIYLKNSNLTEDIEIIKEDKK